MREEGHRERLDYESIVARERRGERGGKAAGWIVILVMMAFVVFVILKGLSEIKLPSPD
jgi:hypothetical protein